MAVVLTSPCAMVKKGTNGRGINKSLLYGQERYQWQWYSQVLTLWSGKVPMAEVLTSPCSMVRKCANGSGINRSLRYV